MLTIDRSIDTRSIEQNTPEWLAARLGHITASSIDDVMAKGQSGEAATRAKYKVRLLAERLTGQGQESFSNSAMEWGKTQEPYAAIAYQMHKGVLLDKTGFWRHPTIDWLGVSPDRLNGNSLVEIKCPNSTTQLNWILANKIPSEYVKQVQAQLWVCEKEYCDFVSFDPRLNEKNQLFIVRVERNEKLIKEMEAAVKQFLSEINELIERLK